MKSIDELLEMDDEERAEYLYKEALYISKRLNPIYEKFIKLSPGYAYWYAKNIIKGRWLEAEEYIKKNPRWAYWYAKYIIKGRWLEAEEYIKKNPRWAYWYAEDIVKGRWKEAEEYIKKNELWEIYCDWSGIEED